jgi:hypothetical protein
MIVTDGRTATMANFDPQLHTLRSIAGALEDPKQKQEAQSARFNLYAALKAGDEAGAKAWLDALETALACATVPNEQIRAVAERAIQSIRGGLAE